MGDVANTRRQEWKEKIERWQVSGQTITAWYKENIQFLGVKKSGQSRSVLEPIHRGDEAFL